MNKFICAAVMLAALAYSCDSSAKEENNDTMDSKLTAELAAFDKAGLKYDTFTTPKGREVALAFIKHGSIVVDIDGYTIYVDPVSMFGTDFAALPKADIILVTHEHHDHFDPEAIAALSTDSTKLVESARVAELFGRGEAMRPGDTIADPNTGFTLTATPAYNTSEGHLQFHPKDRGDIGFVFDIDGLRVYVAGDTEDIPEMADLQDIDIAFLPVNQPYTMTPAQAIHAAGMFRPHILYPYHYGDTALGPFVEAFKGSDIEVRVRDLQ